MTACDWLHLDFADTKVLFPKDFQTMHDDYTAQYAEYTKDVEMNWAHIQQISEETGNEVSDVEDYVKLRAVKRGYPYHINKLTGEIKPESMTKINTVEASYLIDELHMIAAEMEIELYEG